MKGLFKFFTLLLLVSCGIEGQSFLNTQQHSDVQAPTLAAELEGGGWPSPVEPNVGNDRQVAQEMRSRIADKERPLHLGWYERISKEKCNETRNSNLTEKCISQKEFVELEYIGAIAMCVGSQIFGWYFC